MTQILKKSKEDVVDSVDQKLRDEGWEPLEEYYKKEEGLENVPRRPDLRSTPLLPHRAEDFLQANDETEDYRGVEEVQQQEVGEDQDNWSVGVPEPHVIEEEHVVVVEPQYSILEQHYPKKEQQVPEKEQQVTEKEQHVPNKRKRKQ